jgi:hypothetical protein
VSPNELIVHATHHKMGTVWFQSVLRDVAAELGLTYSYAESFDSDVPPGTDIFLQAHSRLEWDKLPAHRGTHMVRDLRDVAVSGYHYHLWTEEEWANIALVERQLDMFFGDEPRPGNPLTYKELLNSLSPTEGLIVELRRLTYVSSELRAWDFENPSFLELRYEDVITEPDTWLPRIFAWYGFTGEEHTTATGIARSRHIDRRHTPTSGTHVRSGKPRQWVDSFGPEHDAEAKRIFGDVLVKMGYETDTGWTSG